MQWNAPELEDEMAAVGASCAMVRSREEWFASEQSQYTTGPLISIEKIGDSDPIPFTPNPDMPLSGIRIIDYKRPAKRVCNRVCERDRLVNH